MKVCDIFIRIVLFILFAYIFISVLHTNQNNKTVLKEQYCNGYRVVDKSEKKYWVNTPSNGTVQRTKYYIGIKHCEDTEIQNVQYVIIRKNEYDNTNIGDIIEYN